MDLFWAVTHNKPDVILQLLEQGSDLTLLDQNGKSALDHSVELGHTECEALLRDHLLKMQIASLERAKNAMMDEYYSKKQSINHYLT